MKIPDGTNCRKCTPQAPCVKHEHLDIAFAANCGIKTQIEDGGECKSAHIHFADGVTIEVPAVAPDYNAMPRALLLAAAPDLLSALKEVVALSDRKHDAWDKAHAAIAKAEGK